MSTAPNPACSIRGELHKGRQIPGSRATIGDSPSPLWNITDIPTAPYRYYRQSQCRHPQRVFHVSLMVTRSNERLDDDKNPANVVQIFYGLLTAIEVGIDRSDTGINGDRNRQKGVVCRVTIEAGDRSPLATLFCVTRAAAESRLVRRDKFLDGWVKFYQHIVSDSSIRQQYGPSDGFLPGRSGSRCGTEGG